MRREDLLGIVRKEQIQTRYQPVIELATGAIWGYEALAKIDPNPLGISNEELFTTAIREGLIYDLELLCRRRALTGACHYGLTDKKLFVNVVPTLLEDQQYQRGLGDPVLRDTGFPIGNVVLEMTERASMPHGVSFKGLVDRFREQGFLIALDDLGAGQAGLRLLVEIEPDVVKLDRFLITNIHDSFVRKTLLRSVINLCRSLGILVLAEGIEKEEELEVLYELGANLGQGYALGAPSMKPMTIPSALMRKIVGATLPRLIAPLPGMEAACATVKQTAPVLHPDDPTSRVEELFNAAPELTAVAVVSDGHPEGMFPRDRFLAHLATQFARDLYLRKPVRQTMQPGPICIEAFEDLGRTVHRLLDRPAAQVYDPFVIIHQGRYLGMGRVQDVLRRVAELRAQEVQEANPLTGLPGFHFIRQELERRLALGDDFAVCWFDLDGFKAFNDHYGIATGDSLIRWLADLLHQSVRLGEFLGHAGGDDFVLVGDSLRAREMVAGVAEAFNRQLPRFFAPEEWERGWFEYVDRQGQARKARLVTLSAGGLLDCAPRFRSVAELINVGADARRQAKAIEGTCIVWDAGRLPLETRSLPLHPVPASPPSEAVAPAPPPSFNTTYGIDRGEGGDIKH